MCGVSDEPSTGYHLFPEYGLIEIVDPQTGESLPRKLQEIVTSTRCRGSIVLRYRTGDLSEGGLTWSPPCLWPNLPAYSAEFHGYLKKGE